MVLLASEVEWKGRGREMGMRGSEEIEIGKDITSALRPISYSLHDSFLHSHCSSCFTPLPDHPFSPTFSNNILPHGPNNKNTILYCSPHCSLSDSNLHVSSAEFHLLQSHPFGDTADLRTALRFLHRIQSQEAASPSIPTEERLAGLLTNREKLVTTREDDETAVRIRDGARAMAEARMRMRETNEAAVEVHMEMEEAALCLVLTNGVEVQEDNMMGRTLGIAIYDPSFCWINHSCSPNASYRFLLSSPQHTLIESCTTSELTKECEDHGPRIVVRSIKRINKGEEVTVTYTDLLQPKAMRQSELWSRYRFMCCCRRCSASPLTYVDHALQEISTASLDSSFLSSDHNFYRDNAIGRLTDYIDEAITEYLSVGDPESCCKKLENILTQGVLDEQLEGKEGKSQRTFRLHPLHFLSLNAYTTLASAYKVRASDSTLYSEMDEHLLEALRMSRTSAAYSLLLAGATHHLFRSESSLVASVSNYWISAGDSLLTLSRSSVWSEFVKGGLPVTKLSSLLKHICSKCSLMDKYNAILFHSQAENADFEDIWSEFIDCVSKIIPKVWSFLIHDCQYLRVIKDPIDFCWLGTMKRSTICDVQANFSRAAVDSYHETEGSSSTCQPQEYNDQIRIYYIFQLGVHCLLYGGYLASIYYGQHSHLTSHIQNILDR